MKGNGFPFILIVLIIFGCIFVKKEDQIREAFMSYRRTTPPPPQRWVPNRRCRSGRSSRQGWCLPRPRTALGTRPVLPRPAPRRPPPPPASAGYNVPGSCTQRDVVRVNGQWRNCCVRCKVPRYKALSAIGDGGRCLSCGVAPPPPPPRLCSSFSCGCGYINTGNQQCANNNCTKTQCCSKIPREEIPHCISQLEWGKNCVKCDPEGWELSKIITTSKCATGAPSCKKIPMVSIENCAQQRDWGKNCIKCYSGYKLSSNKEKCDLIPIAHCKDQERKICKECDESYEISKDGTTCQKIPMKKIPHCTFQRDWGAYCYECGKDQSGYMVNKENLKCIPRPIENCKDQQGIKCNKCKFGYVQSSNWNSCDLVRIKDCASQNKAICVECKQGYKLSEDRRKCDLLNIENCRERH